MRRVNDGNSVTASRDGRYYFDSQGRVWARGYGQVGAIAGWGRWSGSWARDGDYLCGLVKDSAGAFTLQVTDLHGHSRGVAISDTGPHPSLSACSTGTNRALVAELSGMTVRSLSDGHIERTITGAPNSAQPVSPDGQWLAAISGGMQGVVPETAIISLADGTVQARFPAEVALDFFPDGRHLLLGDKAGTRTRIVDWRSGAVLWSRPGGAGEVAASDPVTDKLLVDFLTGSPYSGTDKHDYWILGSAGTATRFVPLVDAPPASAAR